MCDVLLSVGLPILAIALCKYQVLNYHPYYTLNYLSFFSMVCTRTSFHHL